MTESEFTQLADTIFARIENALDHTDIDCNLNGGVMELELEDGAKIIINRHTPNRELWIAAKSGGFHYHLKEGQWVNTRDGSEFFSTLSTLCCVTI
ncbi:MAG: iron donor protein CyaY [Gallionellaceae bacterium]